MSELCLRANAKINLFLEVLDKRHDGYHNIETIFQSIDLHDVIKIRENEYGIIEFECDHPQIPQGSDNLVWRAAELLLRKSGKRFGAYIHLTKNIPVGAGLAGGSADAAAALLGLNDLWGLGYNAEELMQIGGELGADVPFCIVGGTCLGMGKGDLITPLAPIDVLPIVIAKPDFQVSTAWAYKSLDDWGLTREKKSANIFIDRTGLIDISNIGDKLYNVFENNVMGRYPEIAELKRLFLRSGALGTLMTGSGPTVFAIARDDSHARYLWEKVNPIADYCSITQTSGVSVSKL